MSKIPKSFADGRYTVLNKIGEGYTSEVYLARDEAIDANVAIKLADSRTASDENLVRRFEQEIFILERFQHRNLIRHVNHGFYEGKPFLVMEYIEGQSLNHWIKDKKNDAEIVEILVQLLEALKYVHAKGVVHRDLKPANIIIIRTMQGNHLKIIDFGFARWLEGVERITITGEVIGSPAYMAPEQIRSKGSPDHRCDLFTFGIIAFEAFTGVLPFSGETPSETAYKIFSDSPIDLSELRPDLPEKLKKLIMKCLNKQPYHRPPNAESIIKQLNQIQENWQ